MRTAGGVLGILGGIFGFFLAAFALLAGAVGKVASDELNKAAADPTVSALTDPKTKDQIQQGIQQANNFTVVAGGLGLVLVGICILGLLGGIFTFFKPPIGAVMMAIAAVAGFLIASIFWSFSGFLLGLGAILAFIGTFSKPAAQQAQMQPAGVPAYYPPPQAYPPAYPQQNYYPPQQQAYPQPQQNYYPQQQPGFPPAAPYGQANPQPQQPYYPQQQPGYGMQSGQQQYYPRPNTAQEGPQVIPPPDDTKLN